MYAVFLSSAEHTHAVQRGHDELGNALLSESRLSVLWGTFLEQPVGKERDQSWSTASLVSGVREEC
jgi:hypothetical protein